MKRLLPFLLLCLVVGSPAVLSQGATTAALGGKVEGKTVDKVVELPGALVEAIHIPTGTKYEVVTQDDGSYSIQNMKVGGPYHVTFSTEGFKKETVENVFLKLGEQGAINVQLIMESIDAGQVIVEASTPLINPNRTGASQNVALESIESMPSITRDLSDLTRLSPQFSNDVENPGSFNANGRSSRYNNIQIDGSQNNDLFGLGNTGAPGGQTSVTPISMDAIQEFQIVLAPYDVRQGGFTGGGVNVITRSGTNEFHGSAYFYGRNQSLVGKGINETEYPTFKDYQVGFRIGGPIIKDRIFFFVNGELTRRSEPSDYIIDGSGNSYDWSKGVVTIAEAQRFVDILKNTYGYDPGSYSTFVGRKQNSDKLFVRFDANLTDKHHLTVRHNYNKPNKDILYGSTTLFKFPDNIYYFKDTTHSTVFQLNSTLTNSLFNEAIVAYTTIRDKRTGPDRFPQVTVSIRGGYSLRAGTEQYSTANSLNQDVLEITDNLTWIKGKHSFIFGTHNEFYKFDNLFISNSFGVYNFNSLNDFEIGKAYRYEYNFSNTADPLQSSKFSVAQLGFYAGDVWSILPNLKLTFGLRVDIPYIKDTPTANPTVYDIYGIPTDQTPSGKVMWSPRAGFNWDIKGDGKNQLRGGVGLFTGRVPYVWLSNQFGNTGIEFTRYYITKNVPAFVADPDNQPRGFTASTNEINLVDENFKYPSILRADIGFDRQLPWGMVGTVEFVYSKTIKDILYQNINILPTGALNWDGRMLYGTCTGSQTSYTTNYKSKLYSNVVYLTNTDKGKAWDLTFQLQKQFSSGFSANVSYTLAKSYDVNSGTSSQALSNWRYNAVNNDINDPELTYSNYDQRHRFVVALTYQKEFLKNAPTTLSMFFNSGSGRPFSYIYSNDANGDSFNNDLCYVPKDESDIILTSHNWDALNAFINADESLNSARGTILKRNSSREPWSNKVDVRVLQDIPLPWLKGHKLQFSMDIMNFMNLLNKNWGVYRYVNFDSSWLKFKGIDAATGKQKFEFADYDVFSINELASRWQIQFGLRYSF